MTFSCVNSCPISKGKILNSSVPQTVAIVAIGLGVLTDILTAAAISWYLRKLKTGYKRSDTMVNKLIGYAVSRHTLPGLRSSNMRTNAFRSTQGC